MLGQERQRGPWIYVWFCIALLLSVSGMASIVDGFVVWVKFFRNVIDVYRATIREPLANVERLIWSSGSIPDWAFDVFVVGAGMLLAFRLSR